MQRLQALWEAEKEAVPEEAQRQLVDAEVALTRALEECRTALAQNRQVCVRHSCTYHTIHNSYQLVFS